MPERYKKKYKRMNVFLSNIAILMNVHGDEAYILNALTLQPLVHLLALFLNFILYSNN